MGALIYVEILSRHGRLRSRHRFEGLPVTIGRAYDCDVLVDDEFVSPHHVRLELDADGAPIAVDLDSKNGLYALRPTQQVSRCRLEPDTELRIGRTLLRVRTASVPVPEAKTDTLRESRSVRWFASPVALVLSIAAVIAAAFIIATVPDYSDEPFLRRIINSGLPIVTSLFFWIGIWVVASRIATHQFFLVSHATIACTYIVIAACVWFVQALWNFTLVALPWTQEIFAGVWWLIFAGLLVLQLQYVTAWSSRRTTIVCLVVSGFLTFVSLLGAYAQRKSETGRLDYNATLLPIELKLQRDISSADLAVELRALRVKVDESLK